jgi:hypothetical protein
MIENDLQTDDLHLVETFGGIAMKVLVLGHGKHGKDTVAEILREVDGLEFMSSSEYACEVAVFPVLKHTYGYASPEECFCDRRNHRLEWEALIAMYNSADRARLAREIIAECDMYVGMRNKREFIASRDLFDVIIWVDASERMPVDPSMSIDYDPQTMTFIDNNGTLEELRESLRGGIKRKIKRGIYGQPQTRFLRARGGAL